MSIAIMKIEEIPHTASRRWSDPMLALGLARDFLFSNNLRKWIVYISDFVNFR